MSRYEYKVVPAPERPEKVGGERSERYAKTITEAINELAEDGWTFLRTDRLPYTTRGMLGRRARRQRDVMVFQRPAAAPSEAAPSEVQTEMLPSLRGQRSAG